MKTWLFNLIILIGAIAAALLAYAYSQNPWCLVLAAIAVIASCWVAFKGPYK